MNHSNTLFHPTFVNFSFFHFSPFCFCYSMRWLGLHCSCCSWSWMEIQLFTQWIYGSNVFSAMFGKLKHFMLDCLLTSVVNGLNEVLDASMGLKSPCVMLLISNFVMKNTRFPLLETSDLFFSIQIGLYVSIFLICCDCVHVQHALT